MRELQRECIRRWVHLWWLSNGTSCISCPRNMVYSVGSNMCICNSLSSSYTYTPFGCFTATETATTSAYLQTTSSYYNQLKYVHHLLLSSRPPALNSVTSFPAPIWLIFVSTLWVWALRPTLSALFLLRALHLICNPTLPTIIIEVLGPFPKMNSSILNYLCTCPPAIWWRKK
jgi:hypothetical protein